RVLKPAASPPVPETNPGPAEVLPPEAQDQSEARPAEPVETRADLPAPAAPTTPADATARPGAGPNGTANDERTDLLPPAPDAEIPIEGPRLDPDPVVAAPEASDDRPEAVA